jgi:hypothetical protein
MGTWGPGNFENDSALDMVGDVLDAAMTEIAAFRASDRVAIEDLDQVVACIAIHLALLDRCGADRPDADAARAVREKVLRLFDACSASRRRCTATPRRRTTATASCRGPCSPR